MKTWLGAGVQPAAAAAASPPATWCTEYWMDDPDLPWVEAAIELEAEGALEEARRIREDPHDDDDDDHLEREAKQMVEEPQEITNQTEGDTLKVPGTSERPAEINENTAKRHMADNQTSRQAMEVNMKERRDNQGGVQDGQEGGGADGGADGPVHRDGADVGKFSYSSAHGEILFCAKTRKLRNVRRDKLKQLSLKNFTVNTLQNYGGGAERKWDYTKPVRKFKIGKK